MAASLWSPAADKVLGSHGHARLWASFSSSFGGPFHVPSAVHNCASWGAALPYWKGPRPSAPVQPLCFVLSACCAPRGCPLRGDGGGCRMRALSPPLATRSPLLCVPLEPLALLNFRCRCAVLVSSPSIERLYSRSPTHQTVEAPRVRARTVTNRPRPGRTTCLDVASTAALSRKADRTQADSCTRTSKAAPQSKGQEARSAPSSLVTRAARCSLRPNWRLHHWARHAATARPRATQARSNSPPGATAPASTHTQNTRPPSLPNSPPSW